MPASSYRIGAAVAATAAATAALVFLHRRRTRYALRPLQRLKAATTNANEVAAALRSNGVVVIDDVVPHETMDRCRSELAGIRCGGLESL